MVVVSHMPRDGGISCVAELSDLLSFQPEINYESFRFSLQIYILLVVKTLYLVDESSHFVQIMYKRRIYY